MENYELLKYLECGSFGKVWLMMNKETKALFAVKFIARGPQVDKYVFREIMNLKSLCHPNIIQFKEVVLSLSKLGIVMEYAEGGDLHDYVLSRQRKKLGGNMARYFFQQLMSGVYYCHTVKDVCHRDLQPANILLVRSNPPRLKIGDFGYSKSYRLHSKPKSAVGTRECRAPEVCSGDYNGKVADIWSCGVILYYMLVGKYPNYTPNEHLEDPLITREASNGKNACPFNIPRLLPTGAEDLLTRMLVEDPKERITIKEIMEHSWYKEKLPGNLAEATQVTEEYPSLSVQSDKEIQNIVDEAKISPPKDANGIKEDFESGEEEDFESEEEGFEL